MNFRVGFDYFATSDENCAIIRCVELNDTKATVEIIKCSNDRLVGQRGTVPLEEEKSLILATALHEALF